MQSAILRVHQRRILQWLRPRLHRVGHLFSGIHRRLSSGYSQYSINDECGRRDVEGVQASVQGSSEQTKVRWTRSEHLGINPAQESFMKGV